MGKFSNLTKTVKALAKDNQINSNVEEYLTNINKAGNEAKHGGWSSGKSYFLEMAVELHDNGHVNDTVMSYLKEINAAGNKAKHG